MTERDDHSHEPGRTADVRRAPASLRKLPPWRRAAWVSLALAAVFVVAVFAAWRWAAQPRYEWRVTDVVAPAGILAATGDVQLGALQRGGLLQTAQGSEIELQLGGELRIRLLGGGAIELPPPPPRLYSGEILITVRDGEAYGTTRSGALDLPLRVVARDAEAEIHGTTFAVFQEAEFTAICLWRGSVLASSRVAEVSARLQVPAESKVLFYPDGSVSDILPLDPTERMTLQMMADGGVSPQPSAQK